jgi:hypothetical protein
MNISRRLILGLGDPDYLLAHGLPQDKADYFKRHQDTYSLLIGLAQDHGGKWLEVADKLPKPAYPSIPL